MPNATNAAEWDEEYRAGRWDFLHDVKESPRYGILAGWLASTRTTRALLDIGCGEGLLWRHLAQSPARYVGVDLSPASFEKASLDPATCRFVASDLHDFEPDDGERFSAIVFNEVLYFSQEPEAQLARYAAMLEEGGVIAISMYAPKRPTSGAHKLIARVWEASDAWTVLDDLTLSSAAKGVTWKLRLVRPQ
ncbi:2-polyprenyl-6-hydroxyphenyl methylase/3-demethylubiquinone-9 3-methyltransferase [Breoghania corrubedonensis]|uniref:2-polyprenyl-6-hydroxyphenyl methylase/3-demethylubiquinone-9 3-methyltransferase n=1 Tax=Breoghania corrubedonensis TaxID=665038 RepID=A0A2T5V1K2_9HYPH|nr:class I SAM-dependent methyltransferase [Breoghania corrubedonensis]PTW57610.1 2-polyprenyl-6-hydroxyphenyl methylase/3-demethylubiquinone-9 3-methyltransferase [Breoghania corrubedonensis]